MIIQLNTDNNIQGTENLEQYVNEKLQDSLRYFADHITRIEVHLSDQNGEKTGPDDILCKMEARVEGKRPVLVEGRNSSKEKALDEASKKMKSALDSIIGKMKNR